MANTPSHEMQKQKTEDSPPKRFRPNYLETITVVAGNEDAKQQHFIVHKDLVCNRSSFFSAACSSNWAEGKDGVVRLPSIEPETFKLYIHWAYSGKVDLDLIESKYSGDDPLVLRRPKKSQERVNKTHGLFKLYVAADALMSAELKNRVVDQYLDMVENGISVVSIEAMNYLWDNTEENARFRRCIMDDLGRHLTVKALKADGRRLNGEVIFDLCKKALELRGHVETETMPTLQRSCIYHEHEEGVSCLSETAVKET